MPNMTQPENLRKSKFPRPLAERKRILVDLGMDAIARGEWQMVLAITHIIRARGISHE